MLNFIKYGQKYGNVCLPPLQGLLCSTHQSQLSLIIFPTCQPWLINFPASVALHMKLWPPLVQSAEIFCLATAH